MGKCMRHSKLQVSSAYATAYLRKEIFCHGGENSISTQWMVLKTLIAFSHINV